VISSSFGLISTILYSFGLSFFNEVYLSLFLPTILLIFIQKDALKSILKKMLFLNIFIIIMVLSAMIHKEYNYALLIALRANAIILFALLIFHNKSLFDIASGMQTLKLPDKLVSLFFFVGKFIIIIKQEFNITKNVMKIRNFKSKTNLFSYKVYANVIGMLIVKCFDRAEKLKNSMILRNFQGKIYQSKKEKFSKVDFLILFSVLLSLSIQFGKVSL
jgi:cobalt/nickel transport system permease protein